MNRQSSIRKKMTLGTSFLLLLFIFSTSLVWYFTMKSQAERTAIENIQSTVNMAETSIDTKIKDIVNIASLVTVQADSTLNANILTVLGNKDSLTPAQLINYRKSSSEYLISLCSFQNYLRGLRISDFENEGVAYGNTTTPAIVEANDYLGNLSEDGSISFIEPHYWTEWYTNANDYVFSMLKPVKNTHSDIIGYVIADIDSHIFDDYFGQIQNDSSLYVLNEEASRVIYNNENMGVTKELSEELPLLVQGKVNEEYGHFLIKKDNKDYLVAYSRSPITKWVAISIIPRSLVLSDFNSATNKLIFITLAIMMVCFYCIWMYSSAITKNILALTDAVKMVGKEKMSLNLKINSNDEVQELSEQFQNMLSRIAELYKQIQSQELEKRKAEISALQFQMNPHFLYNSLNTIRFLATIQGIENIKQVAEILSSMMHLNMDGRSEITIGEDVEFIKEYLKLQTFRQIALFTSNVEADEDILNFKISKLLVQPLVENCIKHGLSNRRDGNVKVYYKMINDHIEVVVEDNGNGISQEQMDEILNKGKNQNAGHIGLANIKERIRLNYGSPYHMQVESIMNEFTRVTLVLPIIKE